MATKRIEASILLDEERYSALRAYATKKGTNTDGAITLVLNTGLSRIASLDKYQGAKPATERKPRAAKPKAEAKPKVKAKAAAPKAAKPKAKAKAEAKPKVKAKAAAPKAVVKAKPVVKTAAVEKPKPKVVAAKKTGAARIAPARPTPMPLAANGSSSPLGEIAQA